jgi:hypothetical protein
MDSNFVIGQVALGHKLKAAHMAGMKDAALAWWADHQKRVVFDKIADTEMKATLGH